LVNSEAPPNLPKEGTRNKNAGITKSRHFYLHFYLFKKASLKLNLKVQISKNKQITIPQIFNYQTVYEIDFLNLFEI